tara:strand:+ start:838 stop:1305 length:468 start_codon:yes stop_codon:yes gene_type:complete
MVTVVTNDELVKSLSDAFKNEFHDAKSALVAALKLLGITSIILTLVLPWKSETQCSSSSLTLSSDGYDAFVPKHNQALHRGNAVLGLYLIVPSMYVRGTRETVIVIGAAWFLLNEAIIHLAAIRCAGNNQGTVGPGIFTAYASMIFGVWALFSKF